jgi:GNAT superfamily N-acetyltransferase
VKDKRKMKLETNAISIKPALKKQSEALAGLIKSYCSELLEIQSTISPKAIKRDGFGKHFQCVVAESSSGQIVGFAVWEHTYDIHWGVCGGNILDMYVMKELRGFGMAHRMMALICKNILDDGGVFLRGGAIDRGLGADMPI